MANMPKRRAAHRRPCHAPWSGESSSPDQVINIAINCMEKPNNYLYSPIVSASLSFGLFPLFYFLRFDRIFRIKTEDGKTSEIDIQLKKSSFLLPVFFYSRTSKPGWGMTLLKDPPFNVKINFYIFTDFLWRQWSVTTGINITLWYKRTEAQYNDNHIIRINDIVMFCISWTILDASGKNRVGKFYVKKLAP